MLSKSKSKRILQIESLESRAVPAQANLSGGTLAVMGDLRANNLTIVEQNGRLSVNGLMIHYNGHVYSSVGVAIVSKIYVDGGQNNDVIDISTVTKPATVIGGLGDDSITGGQGNDELYGRDGNDTIYGGGGNDKLFGEAGDDTLWGDDGNDTIYGGDGNDVLAGRAGDDVLYCDAGNDLGSGGDGNDSVLGNIGDDSLFGGTGNDTLMGEDGNDQITGDEGDDSLNGGNGNDSISGADGNDKILGMAGDDSLDGGLGNDSIWGGDGNDSVTGGDGDDLIYGENGTDFLHGNAGNDIISGGAGSDFIYGEDGNDIVATGDLPEIVNGGTGDDTISAGSGDVVDGGGGNDTVIAGNGGDNGGGNNGGGDNGGGDNGGGTGGGSNSSGSVLQVIRSNWGSGDTNDITIRNTGATNMNGWTVEFDADFNITEIWNAQLVSHSGNHYKISNIPGFWNTVIKPNTQITFGFNTTLSSGNSTAISNIILNGQALSNNPTPPPNPNPNTQGTVTQAIRSQWSNGTTNDITIKNTGTSTINGWTITFTADFDVTDVWNSQLVSHSGNTWTISNIPGFWNSTIAPGASIVIGFNTFLSPGDSTAMSNITLNGNPV